MGDLRFELKNQKLILTGISSDFKFASLMNSDGIEFRAKEIHFHIMSEHKFNEMLFDMEAQLIFKSINYNFDE